MSVYLGIDPGVTKGALVAIDGDGRCVAQLRVPRVNGSKGPMDAPAILAWLRELPGDIACALEEASIRPRESGRSALTIGTNWGRLDAMLMTLGARYVVVRPQAWRKALKLPTRPAKDADKRKVDAIQFVRRALPSVDLTPGRVTKPHDGIGDAACLAEYARRTFGGAT